MSIVVDCVMVKVTRSRYTCCLECYSGNKDTLEIDIVQVKHHFEVTLAVQGSATDLNPLGVCVSLRDVRGVRDTGSLVTYKKLSLNI